LKNRDHLQSDGVASLRTPVIQPQRSRSLKSEKFIYSWKEHTSLARPSRSRDWTAPQQFDQRLSQNLEPTPTIQLKCPASASHTDDSASWHPDWLGHQFSPLLFSPSAPRPRLAPPLAGCPPGSGAA
jgi:hypothetical protein